MKKVLIVTYYWPPSGGAGVQRWLRFATHLPSTGWEPVILTVDPGFAAYPLSDDSLAAEVPPSLRVIRTKATDWFSVYGKNRKGIPSAGFAGGTDDSLKGKIMRFMRGNLFIPDPRKGWNKYAFMEACRLIGSEGIENVITTSPPHSTQLIGLQLKKRYPAIRWIADLRDPWTDIYYYQNFYPTLISRAIDRSYEKAVLSNADSLITVGSSLKALFASKIRGANEKISVIPNGFDSRYFDNSAGKDTRKQSVPAGHEGKFIVSYIGTLSPAYPVEGLARALKDYSLENPHLVFRFAGSMAPDPEKTLRAALPPECSEFLPYLPHSEAVKLMLASSLLVLIIPEHKSAATIITGKIYEYIASGRPVLCIGPRDGDAASITTGSGSGICVTPGDTASMLQFMRDVSAGIFKVSDNYKNRYSVANLTSELAALLK
ncbi:MAG: glycosyltransferase family 4 protein [Bacteroidales bacterium]|nr:glycosyltransferase family 4 protein [Bacteroidales bacterium]